MLIKLVNAVYLNHYQIQLAFNDGKQGIVDLKDDLTGEMFAPLMDLALFASVTLDKQLKTLVWQNGADLAPEYLYFKAFSSDPQLQQQFREWGYLTQ